MKLLFIFLLTFLSSTQINQAITSGDTEAPTPTPTTVDFITIMSKQGCKAFTDILKLSKALHTYKTNINNGLTTFCPSDAAVDRFAAEYKNLTDAEKVNLLLYHSVPVYLSLEILKSNNGFMGTLATEGGANKFEFAVENRGEDVILETKVNTASIERVLVDHVPFVVYEISEVLMPREFFKGKYYSGAADAPAADAPEADDDDEKVDDGIDNRMNGILMGFLRLFRGLHEP